MIKSIVVAVLLVSALAACSRQPIQPPAVAVAVPVASGFAPYCGPFWSVAKQAYEYGCPGVAGYSSGR